MGVSFSDAAEARHDLAGGAIAALETVVLDEGRLQWIQLLTLCDALDRGDIGAVVHHRERQTRNDAPAVEEDGAGAAGTLVATLLGAGQVQRLAENVKERLSRVDLQFPRFAIDGQPHARHSPRTPVFGGTQIRDWMSYLGHRHRHSRDSASFRNVWREALGSPTTGARASPVSSGNGSEG